VPRHAARLTSVSLTGIVIPKLPRAIGHAALQKKWEEAEVDSKWSNSGFAKNRAISARRKQLSDFERFKVMKLKKQVRAYILLYLDMEVDRDTCMSKISGFHTYANYRQGQI
jgi:ribosomal protein L14E/L6E/L27E